MKSSGGDLEIQTNHLHTYAAAPLRAAPPQHIRLESTPVPDNSYTPTN